MRSNIIVNNSFGIISYETEADTILGNNVEGNGEGIWISGGTNTLVIQNNIVDNSLHGLRIDTGNSFVCHNNFIGNEIQAYVQYGVTHPNYWDYGYPSGGNYWRDYPGTDANADGIGDTPYVIDSSNQDNYPLMVPWTPPNLAVLNITASKTVVSQGYPLSIIVTSTNQGNKIEALKVRVYANTILIGSLETMLVNGPSIVFWFSWDTSNCSQAYVISANVTPLEGETDLSDNTLVYGVITVSCAGDVNLDYVTDGKDFVLVKKAIGSIVGSPRWNSGADLNGDGSVDAQDYQIVKTHIPSIFP